MGSLRELTTAKWPVLALALSLACFTPTALNAQATPGACAEKSSNSLDALESTLIPDADDCPTNEGKPEDKPAAKDPVANSDPKPAAADKPLVLVIPDPTEDSATEAEGLAQEAAEKAAELAEQAAAAKRLAEAAKARRIAAAAAAAKAGAERAAATEKQRLAEAKRNAKQAKQRQDAGSKAADKSGDGDDNTGLWIAIGAGVGVLLIIGCAVLLILKRSTNKDSQAATPAAAAKAKPKAKPIAKAEAEAEAGRTIAILRDLTGTTGQAEHHLVAETMQIGRACAPSDEIQSIVVRMKTVGRRHAVIEYRQHGYWLVDQGSLNGTYLNGERIHGERALHHGSRIQLESAEFEFVVPGAEDLSATVAVDPDLFIETMVASSSDAAAFAPVKETTAARSGDGPSEFLETAVNKDAPPQSQLPGDTHVLDDNPAANPAGDAQDTATKVGSGTVDFDVFGDSSDSTPPR